MDGKLDGLTHYLSWTYVESTCGLEWGDCNYCGLGVFLAVSVGEQLDATGFEQIRREARD